MSLFAALRTFYFGMCGYLKSHLPWFSERYRIVSINEREQQVMLHVVGHTSVLKLTFSEIIKDREFIDGLSAKAACYMGICYGRVLQKSIQGATTLRKTKNMTFLLKNSRGRYKVIFQDRNGNLGYIDQTTKKEFIEAPLTIVQCDHIIYQFDPSQACYIGLLAGISLEKAILLDQKTGQNAVNKLFKKMPTLRIMD